MHAVTNVCFDRQERQVFEKVFVWVGLAEDENVNGQVLGRLAQRNPPGFAWKALAEALDVLRAIIHKAQAELDQYRPLLAQAPETAPENSIIANPRLALETLVQAREQAMRDVAPALDLIAEALALASAPVDDTAGV